MSSICNLSRITFFNTDFLVKLWAEWIRLWVETQKRHKKKDFDNNIFTFFNVIDRKRNENIKLWSTVYLSNQLISCKIYISNNLREGPWNDHPNRLPTNFSFRNKFASLKEHKKLARNPNFYNFWIKSSNFFRRFKKSNFIKICKFCHFLCGFSSFCFCYALILWVPRISFTYSCRASKGASFGKKIFFSKYGQGLQKSITLYWYLTGYHFLIIS